MSDMQNRSGEWDSPPPRGFEPHGATLPAANWRERAEAEAARFRDERALWGERLVAAEQRAREAETAEGLLKAEVARLTNLVQWYDDRLRRNLSVRAYKGALDELPDAAARQSGTTQQESQP